MRKLHPGLAALAAAAMLAGCSQHDELVQGTDAPTANYSFTVSLESVTPQSRADGDGSTNVTIGAVGDEGVTKLYYNAYYRDPNDAITEEGDNKGDVTSGTDKVPVFEHNKTATLSGGQTSINISLPTGASYVVAFFAINEQAETAGIWKKTLNNGADIDLRAVEVDYSKVTANNALSMNAFSGHININHSEGNTNATERTVKLTRAVAQINVGADKEKWTSAVAANDGKPLYTQSSVTIKGLPNKLDILNGLTDLSSISQDPVTFDYAPFLQPDETLTDKKYLTVPHPDNNPDGTIEATEFRWVSMTYILAGRRNEMTVDTEFNFKNDAGNKTNTIVATQLPVRRNFRTNVLGRVLETSDQFNVIIDYKWQGDDKDEIVLTPEEIKGDISLPNNNITLDLGGRTVDFTQGGNFLAESNISVKNLTITNGTIAGGKISITATGKVTFSDVTFDHNVTDKAILIEHKPVIIKQAKELELTGVKFNKFVRNAIEIVPNMPADNAMETVTVTDCDFLYCDNNALSIGVSDIDVKVNISKCYFGLSNSISYGLDHINVLSGERAQAVRFTAPLNSGNTNGVVNGTVNVENCTFNYFDPAADYFTGMTHETKYRWELWPTSERWQKLKETDDKYFETMQGFMKIDTYGKIGTNYTGTKITFTDIFYGPKGAGEKVTKADIVWRGQKNLIVSDPGYFANNPVNTEHMVKSFVLDGEEVNVAPEVIVNLVKPTN